MEREREVCGITYNESVSQIVHCLFNKKNLQHDFAHFTPLS